MFKLSELKHSSQQYNPKHKKILQIKQKILKNSMELIQDKYVRNFFFKWSLFNLEWTSRFELVTDIFNNYVWTVYISRNSSTYIYIWLVSLFVCIYPTNVRPIYLAIYIIHLWTVKIEKFGLGQILTFVIFHQFEQKNPRKIELGHL